MILFKQHNEDEASTITWRDIPRAHAQVQHIMATFLKPEEERRG